MLRGFCLSWCFLMVVGGSAGAETYYVAPPPAGDDGNRGTSEFPWATLQHAAEAVTPGDTVLVREGSYVGFNLVQSGSAGLPITFAAFPGERPEVVADNRHTADGINLEGASYVVIDGFTVNGRGRSGIRAVLGEHVTLRNNIAQGNQSSGIFTGFCDDLLIENNLTSGSLQAHGIYVSNSGDRPVIRGNSIYGNFVNGIHLNGDVSQGGDGVISNALIENNIIFDNGSAGGSGISCDGVQDSLIRNNVIFDQHASGISLYRIDGGEASTGNRVLNNSVHVAADGLWALNIQNGSTENEIVNNCLWSDHGSRGAIDVSVSSLGGLRSQNNAVEDLFSTNDVSATLTLTEWQALTGDTTSFVASPAQLFVTPGTDYHLQQGSPALDGGETRDLDVPMDIEGNPRPSGPAFDIGAYEGFGLFEDGFESGDTSAWK